MVRSQGLWRCLRNPQEDTTSFVCFYFFCFNLIACKISSCLLYVHATKNIVVHALFSLLATQKAGIVVDKNPKGKLPNLPLKVGIAAVLQHANIVSLRRCFRVKDFSKKFEMCAYVFTKQCLKCVVCYWVETPITARIWANNQIYTRMIVGSRVHIHRYNMVYMCSILEKKI